MATGKETSDIAKLQRDVAVMQNDLKYIKEGQDEIKKQLEKMNYVSQTDFDKVIGSIVADIKELKAYNDDNRVGTVFSGLLANKALAVVVGAIILAATYAFLSKGGN